MENDITLSNLQKKLVQLGLDNSSSDLNENNFFVGDSNNEAVQKNITEVKTILNISSVDDNSLNTKADTSYVDTQLNTKADTSYVNTELNTKADTSYVNTQLNTKINKVSNATANNIAVLNSLGEILDGGIDTATLKDGWDGEVNTFADLPTASNNDGKKYVVKTPTGVVGINKKYAGTYISDGSTWNIFGYKQASVINQVLTGYIIASSTSDLNSSDTILTAFQKIQKQLNDADATNLTTGTVSDDRLSTNIPIMTNNVLPAVDGSQLTNLPSGSGNFSHSSTGLTVDLNTMKSTGSYAVTLGSGNKPSAMSSSVDYMILLVFEWGTNNGIQKIFSADRDSSSQYNLAYYRCWEGSSFTNWVSLI